MAKVIVTAKIMPDSPSADLKTIETKALAILTKAFGDAEKRVTLQPIAFGLMSITIMFIMDESLGSPDAVEADIQAIQGVSSWQVIDARRAIG